MTPTNVDEDNLTDLMVAISNISTPLGDLSESPSGARIEHLR